MDELTPLGIVDYFVVTRARGLSGLRIVDGLQQLVFDSLSQLELAVSGFGDLQLVLFIVSVYS